MLCSYYGIKSSLLKWYEKLTSTLINNGYVQANTDHSLFTKKDTMSFTLLLVYVDDILIAGNSLEEFDKIKAVLHYNFKIKNLRQLKYFLGLEVAHSKQGISLCH